MASQEGKKKNKLQAPTRFYNNINKKSLVPICTKCADPLFLFLNNFLFIFLMPDSTAFMTCGLILYPTSLFSFLVTARIVFCGPVFCE